ncbi:hypothetical protein TrRE_jg8021 [Triparma retinervis]|uniref:Uncharacterized protein n=1 Tax=Triparma retinervis TaxID=2557542 RepID=A0A9W7E617_9STRA|nr:hypothetical protein TrRE_jg8021 [Triparma retinervis]
MHSCASRPPVSEIMKPARFVTQLIVVLFSFFTRYYPSYHGQSSFCFFAYLTHWSNTTILLLNFLQLSPHFCANTNTHHFTTTLPLFILTAWLGFVVPFNPSTLSHLMSWIEHLLPAILQTTSLLQKHPPQPPRKRFVLVGVAYLLMYLIWTFIFDLLGLNLHGRDYIYAAISWRNDPLHSSVFSLIALLLYLVIYAGVQVLTEKIIRVKSKKEFEMISRKDSRDYALDAHNPSVIRLASSRSSELDEDDSHFVI